MDATSEHAPVVLDPALVYAAVRGTLDSLIAATGDEVEPLTALRVATAMSEALTQATTEAAHAAAATGADYAAIGDAVGRSRQAVRKRWPDLADITRAARAAVHGAQVTGYDLDDADELRDLYTEAIEILARHQIDRLSPASINSYLQLVDLDHMANAVNRLYPSALLVGPSSTVTAEQKALVAEARRIARSQLANAEAAA